MPKGSVYNPETVEFTDPLSGAQVFQITNNPTTSADLYFENMCFTPDGETVIFKSRRTSERGAPWDLHKVGATGGNITQLTEGEGISNAALSLDGERAFYTTKNELRSVHMETFDEEVLVHATEAAMIHGPSVGGDHVYARAEYPGDRHTEAFRVKIDGTGFEVLATAHRMTHVQASPTGNYVAWMTFPEDGGPENFHVARGDGSEPRLWCEQRWAHTSWVGTTERLQGTMLPPDREIRWAHPDDESPQLVCSGAYFWHSAASPDGEWIVSDTNWPDVGLQLIHVESGRYETLCLSQSSNANPSHPHPSFSPDGRRVIYNSDRTGIGQVYVVEVPDYLRGALISGDLQKRQRRGRLMV